MYFVVFYSLRYGIDSGSLLRIVMGPVEVYIRLSFDGWLFHGQSCHVSYFYKYGNDILAAKASCKNCCMIKAVMRIKDSWAYNNDITVEKIIYFV